MENRVVESLIIHNELKLLEKGIRNNKNELEKLIAKDFVEYGSSGNIYTFSETIDGLLKENKEIKYKIIKMETKRISENVILVLYTIEIENGISNRCSIWEKDGND